MYDYYYDDYPYDYYDVDECMISDYDEYDADYELTTSASILSALGRLAARVLPTGAVRGITSLVAPRVAAPLTAELAAPVARSFIVPGLGSVASNAGLGATAARGFGASASAAAAGAGGMALPISTGQRLLSTFTDPTFATFVLPSLASGVLGAGSQIFATRSQERLANQQGIQQQQALAQQAQAQQSADAQAQQQAILQQQQLALQTQQQQADQAKAQAELALQQQQAAATQQLLQKLVGGQTPSSTLPAPRRGRKSKRSRKNPRPR